MIDFKEREQELANETVVTYQEKLDIIKEMKELLNEYDYDYKEDALWKIVDKWASNKATLIGLFRKHPNYNGKFQIVFSSDYDRTVDRNITMWFTNWFYDLCNNEEVAKKFGIEKYMTVDGVTFEEANKKYMEALGAFTSECYIPSWYSRTAILSALQNEQNADYIISLYDTMCEARDFYDKFGGSDISKDFYNYQECIYNTLISTEQILTDEEVVNLNKCIPQLKVNRGMKRSRVVNKIAIISEISKNSEYNSRFAQYADAINPLKITRHTVISVNPIDYLTMSFGNSWASCHTIDKENRRGMPQSYEGCYSSGTISYMLDQPSIVYYTIDHHYDGNYFELEPKINRCMFHYHDGALVQGRVYPQCNDGENGIYKTIREIAQKTMADLLDVANLWYCRKGTSACCEYIHSNGTHYHDYEHFSNCNISFIKNGDGYRTDAERMTVGHQPISVYSGNYHWCETNIMGDDDDECCCADCGEYYDRDDMYYIDGEWYCEDCCFYCEYHCEWETRGWNDENYHYVEHYGDVCYDALENSGYFFYCDDCERWFRGDGNTVMGSSYEYTVCDNCFDDYVWVSNREEYYHCNDVVYCESCGEYYLEEDSEHGECPNCGVIVEENVAI